MPTKSIADLVFESASDYAILTLDIERRITFWSPGAEQILGWQKDEVLGQTADIIFTPEDRDNNVPHAEMEIATQHGRSMDDRWHVRKDGSRFWASGEMMPLKEGGPTEGYLKILRDRTALKRAQELQSTLNLELGHRMKNMFAVVRAIVDQSLNRATDLEQAKRAIGSRIEAMSRSHELLLTGSGRSADVRSILKGALDLADEAYSGRIQLSGEVVTFGSRAAMSLSLIVHELLTNAIKYGALSVPAGRVKIGWELCSEGEEETFEMRWCEIDGPPVIPPVGVGFGTRLINGGIAGANSRVSLEYAPQGVICSVRASLDGIGAD
jgi:PAS domain S-box-containing protein